MVFKCEMFKWRGWKGVKRRLRYNWRLLFTICVPILLSPIAWALHDIMPHTHEEPDPNKKFKALYIVTLMAAFWVFEVLPVAVTSLFPLALLPLLGVQDAAVVSQNYMKESNMIFLGAIILSLAIEYCGLHIRCALRVISIFGTNPAWIMLGTMMITVVLAMWLSDTSCTSMLLPIISALLAAMFREEQEEINVPETLRNSLSAEDPAALAYLQQRSRRESHVFANPGLSRNMNFGSTASRRRSRSSISLHQHLPHLQNLYNNRHTFEPGELSNIKKEPGNSHATHGDSGGSSRHGSLNKMTSMSIIMEGKTVMEEEEEEEEEEPTPVTTRVHKQITEVKESPEEKDKDHDVENGKSNYTITDDPDLQTRIRKMLLFAVAYAASIGGTGSLIGTGPIKVFKELAKRYELEKSDKYIGITFATWMGFNIPPLLINIIIVWIFLMLRYMGINGLRKGSHTSPAEKKKVKDYLDAEFKKLGPISSHELGVLCIFVFVVLLWFFRDPQLFHGWDHLVHSAKTGDSTAAMLGAVLLFVIPKSWSFLQKGKYSPPAGPYEALLDWKFVSTNAPWGYVLLIGSGYALADAAEESGLSHLFAEQLGLLETLSKPLLLIIVMVITSVITEFVSNTACANLILPIIFTVSCRIEIHPLFLTMASAISASYAFMLPISSPPNAIIFATGELETKEMICNGLFLSIICGFVLFVAILTYGEFFFHFSSFTGVPCP